jgi:aromatic-amino-acid transaminase
MFVATPVQFGDDPVFELHREAMARRAKGRRCINATLGVLMNDDGALAVLPSVVETIRQSSADDWAPYAGATGIDEFLEAVVADRLHAWPGLREHAVAVATPGATGALRNALTAFLGTGEACLTSSLHWGAYNIIAQTSHRRLSTFQLFEPGVARFDVADFEQQLARTIGEQRRALLLINDPCHNPTGYSMTPREWAEVASVLGRYAAIAPVTVLLDSAYSDFSQAGDSIALAALEPLVDRLLLAIAWSASKSFTCYGLRIGALLAITSDTAERTQIRNTLAAQCCGTWGTCNRGGLAAIARLLAEPELRHSVQRDRQVQVDLLAARAARFEQAAAACELSHTPYGGGFFTSVFVDEPQRVAARLRTQGVYVVPMAGALRIALSAVRTDEVADLAYEIRGALEQPAPLDGLRC